MDIKDIPAALGPKLASEAEVIERLRAVTLPPAARIDEDAQGLAAELRARTPKQVGVESFLAEFDLSTNEGVALMCLAEALLRIPDAATIDALIGDKLGTADWDKHLGHADSVLVNASAWGLALTGRFVEWTGRESGGAGDLMRRTLGRLGAPVLRRAIEAAMRIMGQQFVMGQTIEAALARASEAGPGYRHSFDMLGEAARTKDDAERYFRSYSAAIAAIAGACKGKDPRANPGISVKLSALHPRYEPTKRGRVNAELVPQVAALALQAAEAGINFTIDAEEADRLVLSLEILASLAGDKRLAGWDGLGLAVQAYQKRALGTVGWVADLARASRRRFMVRLVKGAYWDSEIKWAQEKGLADYPVFVRKAATDLSYRACAARLLEAKDSIFGQFATHNPRTALEVLSLAGDRTDFEFQKLHGMGDGLYELLEKRLGERFSTRVYAPVGAHRDLLPYLVRRLLENGANTSFIHQVADADIPLARIVADPAGALAATTPSVQLPGALFADRANARGMDLADDELRARIVARVAADRKAASAGKIVEPANPAQPVGDIRTADVSAEIGAASGGFAGWSRTAGRRARGRAGTGGRPGRGARPRTHVARRARRWAHDPGRAVRTARGGRLPALLRGARAARLRTDPASGPDRRAQHADARRARRLRLREPVELPARDLRRADCRSTRRRKHRRRQARRTDAADRGARGSPFSMLPVYPPPRCACSRAGARRVLR